MDTLFQRYRNIGPHRRVESIVIGTASPAHANGETLLNWPFVSTAPKGSFGPIASIGTNTPTHHPAATLRRPNSRPACSSHFQKDMAVLRGT